MYNIVAVIFYPLYIVFCFSLTVGAFFYPFYYLLSDNIIMVAIVGFFLKYAKSLFVKPTIIRIRQDQDEMRIANDREHCFVANLRLFTAPSKNGDSIHFNGSFTAEVNDEMFLAGVLPPNSNGPVKLYFKTMGQYIRLEKFDDFEEYEHLSSLDTCPYRPGGNDKTSAVRANATAVAAGASRCTVTGQTPTRNVPIEIEMSVASGSRSRERKRHHTGKY